jgi:hypothetical protein
MCGPSNHSEVWGEKSVGGGGVVLIIEGSTTGGVRGQVRTTPMGTLHWLCSGDGVDLL